jgi:predicted ATP-dependent serine protease
MKTVRLKDLHIPKEVLMPMKTNTPLDEFISPRGGFLPSTVYIVVGGAGTGKTSWGIDTLSKLSNNYPQKKFLYISGEQDEIDNYELSQYIPGLRELETLYLAGSKNPQKRITETLNTGWDMVLIDSLEVIAGRVQLTTDLNKTQSLKWVMDLMFKHKRGNNPTKTYTTFLTIQQATKKGIFKGDSSIEFDTSGMLYIKRESNDERRLIFTKNRRGPSNISLFYRLGKGQLEYMVDEEEEPVVSNPISDILKALALREFGQKIGINTSFQILKEVEDALDKSTTKS